MTAFPFSRFPASHSASDHILQKSGVMFPSISSCPRVLAALIVVSVVTCHATPVQADKSAVKMTKLDGIVDLSVVGPSSYSLIGIASHLGNYQAYGEVEFGPGDEEGSMIGTGPVVFLAANGDRLVGVATWTVDPSEDGFSVAHVHFGWRDSVEFCDGTVLSNTGHFVKARPPGLVVVVSTEEKIRENVVTLIIRIIFGR